MKMMLKHLVLGTLVSAIVVAQNNESYVDYNTEANPSLFPITLAELNQSFPNCETGPLSTNLVCNTSAHFMDRARALVSEFTLEELILNTANNGPGVSRLGLPAYGVWKEALHGVARALFEETLGDEWSWATSFPQPILSMAGLNRTMIHTIADIISTQGRAYSNVGRWGLNAYSPNINGFRSPMWGRGQETPGEDAAFLSSVYAYEFITGLQGGVDPDHLKIVANAKHLGGYDLENWDQHSRLGFDAIISEQDLADYYTPQFLASSRHAKVGSVMCSYNSVNGVPSCANSFFLESLLRDSWNFVDHGFVSSDCGAVYNIFNPHGYAANDSEAAAIALLAGTDVNCGQSMPWHLNESFVEGRVSRNDIETALTRLYANLVRLGFFDGDAGVYRNLAWSDVVATDAMNISYEAAVEGITLLKNDGMLPLSSSTKSIALIGPWANVSLQLLGNYYGTPPYLISPLQAAEESGLEINYAFGTNISSNSTAYFAGALEAASQSDAIVYFGGIDNTIESEALDRMNITWPGNQLDLIEQLSKVGKPMAVVQMGGGQVDSSSIKNNEKINALLWGGYPGQSGGYALMDILMGRRAPAGRLVTTQYPAEYAYQFPAIDMGLRPNGSNPGQTYMWYTGTPVYEFGHGIFYTEFEEHGVMMNSSAEYSISDILSAPHGDHEFIEAATFMNFTVCVTNKGDLASPYSAMLFVNTSNAGPAPYPNKWLVGFDRIDTIEPGQVGWMTIQVPIGILARADSTGNRLIYPGTYELALNNERSVVTSFSLTGAPAVVESWPAAHLWPEAK